MDNLNTNKIEEMVTYFSSNIKADKLLENHSKNALKTLGFVMNNVLIIPFIFILHLIYSLDVKFSKFTPLTIVQSKWLYIDLGLLFLIGYFLIINYSKYAKQTLQHLLYDYSINEKVTDTLWNSVSNVELIYKVQSRKFHKEYILSQDEKEKLLIKLDQLIEESRPKELHFSILSKFCFTTYFGLVVSVTTTGLIGNDYSPSNLYSVLGIFLALFILLYIFIKPFLLIIPDLRYSLFYKKHRKYIDFRNYISKDHAHYKEKSEQFEKSSNKSKRFIVQNSKRTRKRC